MPTVAANDNNPRVDGKKHSNDGHQLLMFALPHHQILLGQNKTSSMSINPTEITDMCFSTFHGSTCLVIGNTWKLTEDSSTGVSFTAARPPDPEMIPSLAAALSKDIHYKLSSNTLRGASDTYFSGKILARMARVIVIADELARLASSSKSNMQISYAEVNDETLWQSVEAAASVPLPSHAEILAAVVQLKEGVDVWLSTKAEAPYVYDKSWGGIVNCGCTYVGKGDLGVCNNTFPMCPALVDVNEDFGNGMPMGTWDIPLLVGTVSFYDI